MPFQGSDQGVLFRIHSSGDIAVNKPKKRGDYDIEGGSLKNMETSFVKKFVPTTLMLFDVCSFMFIRRLRACTAMYVVMWGMHLRKGVLCKVS